MNHFIQKKVLTKCLLISLLMIHGTQAHTQEALEKSNSENSGRASIEEQLKQATASRGNANSSEDSESKPIIKMEDGEVVIERDGVETVMDPDDVTPSPVTRAADPDIEEVVIIGIQRALQGALEEKRQTTNLTDVINAEDIGKLPDENVAEVLENIPGVQITREGGIGAAVSIRGSDENRVEINGRGTLSDSDNRGGVRFSDLPAALVRSLTVTKVPTADMVEGSVGGTINVKTFRGLKLKKPLLVLNPRAEYADNAETWNQNYSGTAGNKFDTPWGDLGVILTVSHFDKTVREDILRVSPSLRQVQGNTDFTRFPGQNQHPQNIERFNNCCNFDNNPNTFDPYYYPGYSETEYGLEDRENTTASGSLEWQAHDSLKLFAEGTYSSIKVNGRSPFAGASFGFYSGSGPPFSDRELDGIDRPAYAPAQSTFGFAEVAGVQVPFMNSGCIGCGIRNELEIDPIRDGPDWNPNIQPNDGMQIRPGNRNVNRDTDNFVAAIGGEWLDDEWLIEVEASASGSDSTTEAFSNTWQYNDPSDPSFHSLNARLRVPMLYDARDEELAYGPVPYGLNAGPGSPSPADNLLNPDYYSLYVARDTLTQFNNDLYAQRIDIERFLETPLFTSAAFGFRSSQRSTERQRNSVITDTFPCQTTSTPASDNPCADPNVYSDLTQFLVPSPGNFFSFNPDAPYLRDFLTTGSDRIPGFQAELVNSAGLAADPVLAPQQGFKVDEHTYAGYLRLDFETDRLVWPIKGNAGLRFVHTDQTAAGNQLNADQSFSPVSVNQNYNNWLPSASLIVSPLEDLQVRFGYAKILRRPSFAQLAPTFEYPLNDGQAVTVGDPNLRPTTVQQFDAGIEWYFLKGSVLSAGYFYKSLNRPIGTEFTYNAICNPLRVGDRPENCTVDGQRGRRVDKLEWKNLPGGQIQGLELAFQHKFNWLPDPLNGFGILANYAYQDGERDLTFTAPGVLQNKYQVEAEFPVNFRRLSKHSYNVTLYYEKPRYGFSGRIRYTWRSNFLITESSDVSYGRPLYRDDRGQLNASLSLRLPRPLDNFTVILWGINLTKTPSIERAIFPDGPIARMKDADRRYAIGVRARF